MVLVYYATLTVLGQKWHLKKYSLSSQWSYTGCMWGPGIGWSNKNKSTSSSSSTSSGSHSFSRSHVNNKKSIFCFQCVGVLLGLFHPHWRIDYYFLTALKVIPLYHIVSYYTIPCRTVPYCSCICCCHIAVMSRHDQVIRRRACSKIWNCSLTEVSLDILTKVCHPGAWLLQLKNNVYCIIRFFVFLSTVSSGFSLLILLLLLIIIIIIKRILLECH